MPCTPAEPISLVAHPTTAVLTGSTRSSPTSSLRLQHAEAEAPSASMLCRGSAVFADAGRLDVPAQNHHEHGRDGDRADVVLGTVLESAFFVGIARVGPLPVDLGSRLGEADPASAGFRQPAVLQAEAGDFRRAHGRVVHAGENAMRRLPRPLTPT